MLRSDQPRRHVFIIKYDAILIQTGWAISFPLLFGASDFRGARTHDASERPHEAVGRDAHGFVIVNDSNKWKLRHNDLSLVRRQNPTRHRHGGFKLHHRSRSQNDT